MPNGKEAPTFGSDPGNRNEKQVAGLSSMTDEKPTDKTGNEPAPLLLIVVAISPLLAIAGWLVFG
jgi:hypothetical protein